MGRRRLARQVPDWCSQRCCHVFGHELPQRCLGASQHRQRHEEPAGHCRCHRDYLQGGLDRQGLPCRSQRLRCGRRPCCSCCCPCCRGCCCSCCQGGERGKMMTWASASSTKLCRPRDDCRKQCQLPVQYLLLSCRAFLFQV